MNSFLDKILTLGDDINGVQKEIANIRSIFEPAYFERLGSISQLIMDRTSPVLYPGIVAEHRELCGIVTALNISKERAAQAMKNKIMTKPPGEKAPAATLLESMAETSDEVLQWQKIIVIMTTLRDQYAGLVKSVEIAQQQPK